MSEVADKIRSKGYWDVTIRPETFSDQRVEYGALYEVLEAAAVRFRGWPVPYVDRRRDTIHGDDWIGQDVDASTTSHYEAWRFFMSGQFNHLRAVSADWRYVSLEELQTMEARAPYPEILPQGFDYVIEIWEILFYITEVFELAGRLALTPAGDETMSVSVQLNARERRGLIVGQSNRVPFDRPYGPPPGTIAREVAIPRERLLAEPRGLAVDTAREFLLRFGWTPSREQLVDHQEELFRR